MKAAVIFGKVLVTVVVKVDVVVFEKDFIL